MKRVNIELNQIFETDDLFVYFVIFPAINTNNMESNSKSQRQNSSSSPENYSHASYDDVNINKSKFLNSYFSQFLNFFYIQEKSFDPDLCPASTECSKMNFPCIKCQYDLSCFYGDMSNVSCEVKNGVQCLGNKFFHR